MASVEARLHPLNSLLLVLDSSSRDLPESMGGQLVAASTSSVAVGTRSEADGPTTVRITDEEEGQVKQATHPLLLAFEGKIDTPSARLVVESVLGERYMEFPWAPTEAELRIWVNDLTEPDEIVISLRRIGAPQ
jgi:hypothetical protein